MDCPLCRSSLSEDRPRYCITLREVEADCASILDGETVVRKQICKECWQEFLSECAGPVEADSTGSVARGGEADEGQESAE